MFSDLAFAFHVFLEILVKAILEEIFREKFDSKHWIYT